MVKSILLATAFSFSLTGIPLPLVLPHIMPSTSLENKCALPSPGNIQLEFIGSDFIQVGWEPVEGAAYYRIKVYKVSTGNLAGTQLVTALPEKNSGLVGNLEPGQNYNISVYSVCSNGIESPKRFQ